VSGGHTAALTVGLRGWLTVDGRLARVRGGWRERPPQDRHVRLRLRVGDRRLELEDLLRMATLAVDIDESHLGVDVLELTTTQLQAVTGRTSQAIKTVLMDQRRIAGIGNLIADEILYQAGLDPRRRANELDVDDVATLWTAIRRTRQRVLERNGSHQGVLIQSGSRERGERCPRCGVEVQRIQVGGRTTYFCPQHQT
jgi:formamidopyrimidine-DNA glycosylase